MAKEKSPLPIPNPGVGGTYLFDSATGSLTLVKESDSFGDLTDGCEVLPEADASSQD